jgi:N-acetylmuramoyl-L-alanine amidase
LTILLGILLSWCKKLPKKAKHIIKNHNFTEIFRLMVDKWKKTIIAVFVFSIFYTAFLSAQDRNYHSINLQKSCTVNRLLQKYALNKHTCNKAFFLNQNVLKKENFLFLNNEYILPIAVYKYNGKSIRSTLGIVDLAKAKRIEQYNNLMYSKGLRKTTFKQSRILWVPYHELECNAKLEKAKEQIGMKTSVESPTLSTKVEPITKTKKGILTPYFGVEVEEKTNKLAGQVFYVKSGHGGPDPGALCTVNGRRISEDEYAYDVALRLAKELKEQGAIVYMINHDPNDGIREDMYLKLDNDEEHADGQRIPINQLKRLSRRVELVNGLYHFHKRKAKSQKFISIHVDSRKKRVRQDVFFYYKQNDSEGKALAKNLWKTFDEKYEQHRVDDYDGTIGTRELYVLKNALPTSVYVELGNIQNTHDQKRILDPRNRQLLADWLFEGLTGK